MTNASCSGDCSLCRRNVLLWMVVSLIVACIGVVFNAFTVHLILARPVLKRPHYVLTAAVALCCIANGGVFVPLEVTQSFSKVQLATRIGTADFCALEHVPYLSIYSSLFVLQLVIAVNRFLAVFVPVFFHRHVTNGIAVATSVAVLLINVLLSATGYMTKLVKYEHDPHLGDCEVIFSSNIFRYLLRTQNIFISCGLSLILYLLIFLRLALLRNAERRKEALYTAQGSLPMLLNAIYFVIVNLRTLWNVSFSDCARQIQTGLWRNFLERLGYTVIPVSYFLLDGNMRSAYIAFLRRNRVSSTDGQTSVRAERGEAGVSRGCEGHCAEHRNC